MNGNVKTEKLHKGLVFTKAKKVGKIVRIIFVRVDSGELAVTKNIAIDSSGDVGKFGDTEKYKHTKTRRKQTTHRSIASSKVGPQYSFLETPSWYALAKAEP